MIAGPKNWQGAGRPISLNYISEEIKSVLEKIDCCNLALSGGVDSTLMLSLMVQVFGSEKVKCFNIASSDKHPDYYYSEMAVRQFGTDLFHFVPDNPLVREEKDFPGDEIVRAFFRWVERRKVNSIVACDGIDEFNGGYYAHIQDPSERTYFRFLRNLQEEQLAPLQRNSGKVKVYLPYIYDKIILLWSQIPLSEKFDWRNRKKVVCELARMNDVPEEIIVRCKYGFVDAMRIK